MNEKQKKIIRYVFIAAAVGGLAWWMFRPGLISLKDRISGKF